LSIQDVTKSEYAFKKSHFSDLLNSGKTSPVFKPFLYDYLIVNLVKNAIQE